MIPTVVFGDGWAALGSVAVLLKAGKPVHWISGAETQILAPLPAADEGAGAQAWKSIAEGFGIETGAGEAGSFLREFKNKAFREPKGVQWLAEASLMNAADHRFELSLGEIEEQLRDRILNGKTPGLRRVEGIPLTAVKVESGRVVGVVLGSGEEIPCAELIYAGSWATLGRLQGLPKSIPFARGREPVGVLQAVFKHKTPMGAGTLEGFFGAIHREAGEEYERHVWGYFCTGGTRSIWSVCLSSDEVEDNHEISKRLRKLKTALDRMFSTQASGGGEFMASVEAEQVRFENARLFARGERVMKPCELDRLGGVRFLTDGYGPSAAFAQAACLSPQAQQVPVSQSQGPEPQAKDVDR